MKIEKNTIVSLRYKLTDAQNNVIEEPDSPMVYLHGGYDGTFPKIESLLDGQDIGYEATIQLEPNEAFGEYDPELLKIEPRARFPEPLEVGMQFEGVPDADTSSENELDNLAANADDSDDEPLIYTVTDVADSQVVLDGNHPLAGMALRFWVQVEDVRAATEDEIENRHPEGGENFTFGMPNDDADDEEDFLEQALGLQGQAPRTLH
ncbi:peptidylprolyl isomerase [Polynucleobacter sp. QLW-P1DATA-2]|uniref:FKBP-type peptidyl-prolyl cis-trans isomerase n=1 Tax=unclassified Polynucleobacter TaxID=2640945 RepID=UPI0008F86A1B|nr:MULTISPECIES: peptidylprolyl isomerase [unclassified Polynucleobacter]OIM98940.1 peptidylprolyl isomerase [Polynucleobacter sp. MWH-Tro8-2-5-gr]OIN01365.1 peptidylprolyl isomerase [Polynucleobacter sp. QLW-P1DATA-2]